MLNVRMLAVDPMMSNGLRIHTLGWSDPEHILSEYVRGLNYAIGSNTFQADPLGIFYTPSVPYRPVLNVFTPYTEDAGQILNLLDGDSFKRYKDDKLQWPYQEWPNIGGLNQIENPNWAGFDIVADRNAGKFDMLIFFAPGAAQDEGRYNGLAESYGVWAPNDSRAYALNGGTYYLNGLDVDKPFMILYSNLTRGVGELTHSFSHAALDSGALLRAFNYPGYNPQRDHEIRSILTPTDLFLTYDDASYERGIVGQAHVGTTHFLPNSISDYDYNNPNIVPSNAKYWANYPDGEGWVDGKFVLSNQPGTFGPADLATPELLTFEEGHRPYLWQMSHWPRRDDVKLNSRSCNWWNYVLDLNNQEGFDQPVEPPITEEVPPEPQPTPEYTVDDIVLTAMNQLGDSPLSNTDQANVAATGEADAELRFTLGTRGVYFSIPSKNLVGAIPWSWSEVVQ